MEWTTVLSALPAKVVDSLLRPPVPVLHSVVLPVVLMALIALPFGLSTGFFRYRPLWRTKRLSWVCGMLLVILVSPGITEELFFRVVMLPLPSPDMDLLQFCWVAAGPWAVFVGMHLVNPRKQSRLVFWDWRFLVLAGVLGAACSYSYWASGGSVWGCVVAHWAGVSVWQVMLGGAEALGVG